MKKITAFLLLLLSLSAAFAQDLPLLIDEEFNDNRFDWTVGKNSYANISIRNGRYSIAFNISSGYLYRSWNTLYQTQQLKQMLIEVKLKQVSGDPTQYFGIMWDSDHDSLTNEFFISCDGYYKIRTKDFEGNVRTIVPSTRTSIINPFGQYNVLKIYRHGWFYDFFINGHPVARVKVPKMGVHGDDLGFVLTGKMRIVADYVKIYGQTYKLNIVQNPIKAQKINLGSNINTSQIELSPYITADGKKLYFVRRKDDSDDDDIYVSQFVNGQWTKAQKLGAPFNNDWSNSIDYVSPDGNLFIVSGVYDQGKYISDMGVSMIYRKSDNSFSQPQQIVISDFFNDWDYYNFTFSPDRNIMIMAIEDDRNTFGGSDLYVSFLQPDGTYSSPKNLGPDINTPFNEGTPFLAPDNRTLYFSSSGFPGYGWRDIFVSRRLDDTWQHWSEPENLGPYINTAGWDAYFTLDAAGKNAYLVSDQGGFGQEDIFMVPLSESARPNPTAEIVCVVKDSVTAQPVYARIYYSKSQSQLKDYTMSNSQTGEAKLVLPLASEYYITVMAKGYLNNTQRLVLPDVDSLINRRLVFLMKPIQVGQQFVLSNIYFPAGRAEFMPKSYAALERLLNFMRLNPDVKILVSGHTNNIGDYQKLMELSRRRAEAVKNYLISHGISADRIQTVGYGPNRPIADNSTLEGRRKNQRVEVKIISN